MRTVCFLFFAVIPALVFARDATFRFIGGDNVGIPGDSYYSQTLALRFRHLARTALDRGCGRLEWACLDWNRPSIDFYTKKMRALPMEEWTTYRLTGETLEAAAGEKES